MNNIEMPKRWQDSGWVWLSMFPPLIALDQWTKHLATTHLEYLIPEPVVRGLNWTLVHNEGAAFSFLSEAGGWQRWFFSALAVIVSLLLVYWLRREPRTDWRQCAPFALIISGAIGNLIDRLRFGYVVDFVQVYYSKWSWPTFNVADSAICVGAVMLVLLSFTGRKDGQLSRG